MACGLLVSDCGNGIEAFQRNLIAINLRAFYARIYWAKAYICPKNGSKQLFIRVLMF